jgi:hypothetical protein
MTLRIMLLYLALLRVVAAQTRSDNIYLEGNSYLAVNHPNYPSRIELNELSTQIATGGGYPVESYWFVKPDDAHVVVHVANGRTVLFLELSGTKTTLSFPADSRVVRTGAKNDVIAFVANKAGQETELSLGGNAHLTVHVERRDALHLVLTFDGALAVRPGPPTLVPVTGRIALAKHSAALAHLPDAYADCDNTIYDKWSPHDDLGQFRSATNCETRFHHTLWSAIDKALDPAFRYLRSQHFVCDRTKENPGTWVYREREHQLFSFNQFGHEVLTGSCQPDPSVAQQVIPLSRMEALMTRFSALPLDPPPKDSARVNRERKAIEQQLAAISTDLTGRHQVFFEVKVNESSGEDYPLDIAGGSITKVSDQEYVVENTTSPKWGYNNAGGTYLLLGRWQTPHRSGDVVSFAPDSSSSAKPLSIQALWLRIGCGDALAKEIRAHLDPEALRQLLQIAP